MKKSFSPPVLVVLAAICGSLAIAAPENPEFRERLRQEKERIAAMFQAAEKLQAAVMENEANQLRERAKATAAELERRVHEAEMQQARDREQAKARDREAHEREGAAREEAVQRERQAREREASARERGDREGPRPEAERRVPPDRAAAQLEELHAMVRRLAERLERLEVAVRQMQEQRPK
jgi:hypothetical protein